MVAARELVTATVYLVAELSEEDKAEVPKFDLTQGYDGEAGSPVRVQVASVALSPASSRDGEEVHCWPVLPGIVLPSTNQDKASVSCVGGSSSASS